MKIPDYKTATHCIYCEREFVPDSALSKTKDHIIPKVCGGPNHPINYAASCKSCNEMKGGRSLPEFAQSLLDHFKYVQNTNPLYKLMYKNSFKLYNKTSKLHKKYSTDNICKGSLHEGKRHNYKK